jgi:hypothetical protein
MEIHNRLSTTADCLAYAERYPEEKAAWLRLADRMFCEKPCTDGSMHWSQAQQYFKPYDQDAEALDGYVLPRKDMRLSELPWRYIGGGLLILLGWLLWGAR